MNSRRRFLCAASLLLAPAVAPLASRSATAKRQPREAAISSRLKLHSFGLRVSDVPRSLAFYRDFFGAAPITLRPLRDGEMPGYTYIGLSIRDFHRGEIQARLADFGVTPLPAAPELTPALLQSWPGSRADTELLYFTDTEGLLYQLSSPDYCDGLCQSAEAVSDIDSGSSAAPLFMPTHLSHFTNRVADRERANRFHRLLFGIDYQAYQGPAAPIIGVGDGIQFLMYIGGGQSATGMPTAEVHHACFGIENFDLETNRRAMTDYGLSPIDDGAVPPPLSHWVSMRMPDRGGAENGTPELYFTDPDGIRMQLQHPAYCGGGGYLGNRCPPLPL